MCRNPCNWILYLVNYITGGGLVKSKLIICDYSDNRLVSHLHLAGCHGYPLYIFYASIHIVLCIASGHSENPNEARYISTAFASI